ncbi:hypothetical protein BGX33_007785 [Mortierella sp. NVP41]|nr:hypothetical protein BGX33_007785 [Mortierella sp. NVP41]
MANDQQPSTSTITSTDTFFQTFRSEREKKGNIRIPVVRHPTLGELYVIWTDITDCFPGATRIQYDNVFIPMLRDKRCYRVRPHGIRYHPGIVLDVVYGEKVARRYTKNKNRTINGTDGTTNITTTGDKNATQGGTHQSSRPTETSSAARSTPAPNGRDSTVAGRSVGGSRTLDQSSRQQAATPDDSFVGDSDDDLYDHEDDLDDEYDDRDELDQDEDDGDRQLEVEQPKKAALEVAASALPEQVKVEPSTPAPAKQPIKTNTEEAVTKPTGDKEAAANQQLTTTTTTTVPTVTSPLTKPAAVTAAEAAIAAAGAAGTTKALLVAVQEIASALMSESNQRAVPHMRAPREGPLLVSDLVEHRVKDMLKSRYTWSQCGHSRFFCFLPILKGAGAVAPSSRIHNDTKFDLYYICDCGDIPGFENRWYPHWNIKDDEHHDDHQPGRSASESVSQQQLDLIIPVVGEYIMGVLEMLKYGVYIDNVLKVPAQASPVCQQRLSLAIKYLESKGIMSCEKYMADAFADPESVVSALSLDGLKPIPPLDKDTSRKFEGMLVQHRWEKYDEMNPYRTTGGDTRWVCLAHWYDMSPQKEWVLANKFSTNPASIKSKYDTAQGVFSSELNNIQRAREYFQLAEKLTTTPMFRIMLNWDLVPEEMDEIAAALGRLSAAGVLVKVKSSNPSNTSGSALGFGTSYIQLAMAALRNPKIDIFRMIQRLREDETEYPIYNERDFLKDSSLSMDGLAYFSRAAADGRVKATFRVVDIDRAAKTVRGLAKGLHRFSELCLSIESVWKEVSIKFAAPDSGKPGCDVEDTDFVNGDMLPFFEKRQGCDEVKYDCFGMADNKFLNTGCLQKVRIGFSLATDRVKLRDIIKQNRNLKEIDLENLTKDDPSQIYESCKALLANHPSIKSFEVRQRHKNKTPSSFEWKYPNDPTKMRVSITCFEGDKVQSMFQKYASVIETLSVEQLQQTEATVLEKSMRPKKGPMVLRRFSVMDVHLMEPAVIEDLKKIILRSNFEDVTVAGSVMGKRSVPDHEVEAEALEASKRAARQATSNRTKNTHKGSSSNSNNNKKAKETVVDEMAMATIWADFLMAIRSKLTHLSVWGKGTPSLLAILDSRLDESMDMPLLDELSVSGDWEKSLFECRWMEAILRARSKTAISTTTSTSASTTTTPGVTGTVAVVPKPIKQLHIADLTIHAEEWEKLLQYLDFSKISRLDVRQKNAISGRTYGQFVDAIPAGKMKYRNSIAIHDDGTLDGETILAYEEIIRAKTCGQNVMIMINGYHIFT